VLRRSPFALRRAAVAAACLVSSCKPPESRPPTGDEPLISGPEDPDHEAPDWATGDRDDEAASPAGEGPRPPQTIYRSELDRALARGPAYLMRELGPEPFRLHRKFVGWEVTRVFPDDPELCRSGCDLVVGDVILSVNGNRLETPEALSQLIETLPRLTQLEVASLREQRRRVVTYRLVEDR
jgi:hypothetical protein